MSPGILIGLALVLAVVALSLRPLWRAQQLRRRLSVGDDSEQLENLLFERETLLVALRDLHFDHSMSKLSDGDFTELDAQYRARAIDVLQQLDALGLAATDADDLTLDSWIEQAVAAVRGGQRASTRGREEPPAPSRPLPSDL